MVAIKFLGLGVPELVLILLVALVIFGPKNLPKLGETLGKTVRGVREGMEGKELEEAEVVETRESTPVATNASETKIEYVDDDDDEYEEVVIRRKKAKPGDS